jgi:xylulokinase
MLLLGIDLGTSSVKVSVIDAALLRCLASTHYPETENEIISAHPGWAEQSPEIWWDHVQQAITKLHAQRLYNPKDIAAIGIAYQMHGLVIVDKDQQVLRNSIIWCDSRAVDIGNAAFATIGEKACLSHLLNSPGNFTASKLAWVKQHETAVYNKIHQFMLPGDFIAMKLTGVATTTISALSEGIFWDYLENNVSDTILSYYGFDKTLIPSVKNVFEEHGHVHPSVAEKLSLKPGIPVTYKAGDQPNNAFALNVLHPGEVAATAGTSGVIYGVSDQLTYDPQSRVNTFAHVNYTREQRRLGVLLCINGAGILNRWIKNTAGSSLGYDQMNHLLQHIEPGSAGLKILPFGNGAERVLNNRTVFAQIHGIDFNNHSNAHLFRAAQEGVVFSLRYGLDVMRESGLNPRVIRANKANLFLSSVFAQSFANVNNVAIEFYEGDGSLGAALGAGVGANIIDPSFSSSRKPVATVEPVDVALYNELYLDWKSLLEKQINALNI